MVQPRGIILPLTVQVTISSLRLPPPPESPLGATVGAEGQGHTYIHCQYNSWRQSQQSPVEVTTHLKGNSAMLSAPKLHLVDSSLQPSGHKSDSSTTKSPLPHLKLQISQCWGVCGGGGRRLLWSKDPDHQVAQHIPQMLHWTLCPHLLAVCVLSVRACWVLHCPGCCWRWPGTHNPSRESVPSHEQTLRFPQCLQGLENGGESGPYIRDTHTHTHAHTPVMIFFHCEDSDDRPLIIYLPMGLWLS